MVNKITNKQYFDAIKTIDQYSKQNGTGNLPDITQLALAVNNSWCEGYDVKNDNITPTHKYCKHCSEEAKVGGEIRHKKDCTMIIVSKYLYGINILTKTK